MAREPVRFSVKLHDESGVWFNNQIAKATNAIKVMAQSIKSGAQMKAPYDGGGQLRKSARVLSTSSEASVIFGGSGVAYAGYQERGSRYDGTHQVHNYTTSGTGAHYLEETGKRVVEEGIRKWLH